MLNLNNLRLIAFTNGWARTERLRLDHSRRATALRYRRRWRLDSLCASRPTVKYPRGTAYCPPATCSTCPVLHSQFWSRRLSPCLCRSSAALPGQRSNRSQLLWWCRHCRKPGWELGRDIARCYPRLQCTAEIRGSPSDWPHTSLQTIHTPSMGVLSFKNSGRICFDVPQNWDFLCAVSRTTLQKLKRTILPDERERKLIPAPVSVYQAEQWTLLLGYTTCQPKDTGHWFTYSQNKSVLQLNQYAFHQNWHFATF